MNFFQFLFWGLLFSFVLPLQAQEQLGLRLENYAGVGSLSLNPTWQSTNPLAWDVNLVGLGQFIDNNYAYLENTNVRHVLRNTDNIRLPEDDSYPTADDLIVQFNDSNHRKYGSSFTEIMGPSLSIRIKENHLLGFFTKVRSGVSGQRIPATLNYNTLSNRSAGQEFEVAPAQIAAMAWSEIGLNYAQKIDMYAGYLVLGANAKFLTGYEGAYIKNNTTFSSSQEQGDTIIISVPDITFGYTNSNINIENEDFQLRNNGKGLGFDIGATYVYEGNEENYKFKIGASIMDIGHIRFSRNATDYRLAYDANQTFVTSEYDYDNFENLDSLVSKLSTDVYGNTDELATGNAFKIGLPTAFSVQADYLINPMFYVSGVWVQAIPLQKVRVQRGNMLALAPRFEHRWFAASLPVSIYNYEHIHFGLSVRLGFLTLGSENITSIVGNRSRLWGTDFYMTLKINPFDLGWNSSRGGNGKHSRDKIKCYSF